MKSFAHRILFKVSRPTFFHVVVLTRVALGALLLSGCVSSGSYDAALDAGRVESAQRAEAERRLSASILRENELAEELAKAKRDLLEAEVRSDELAVSSGRLEGDLELYKGVAEELGRSLERLSVELRAIATASSTASLEKDALLAELADANSEVTRLGAQIEELVLETREKARLEERLDATLGELAALRKKLVVDHAPSARARSRTKTSS